MPCGGCERSAAGRWCAACEATAVRVAEQARPVVRRVVRWAEGLGLVLHPAFVLRVALIDRPERPGHMGSTVLRRRVRGRRVHTRVLEVRILRGLPELVFGGVVAHELAHVWSALRRWRLHPWAEEGFGELLAYRFYCDDGSPPARFLARRIEVNPDPIYGGGFRRMRRLLGGWDPGHLRRFITGY